MIQKITLVILLSLTLVIHTSFARCEYKDFPQATLEELKVVQQWAIVLAFIPLAEKAGYIFDAEKYLEDHPNPNQAAFNFGYVTGRSCYPIEVSTSFESYSVVLTRLYYLDFENFKVFYDKEATRYGYMEYLTPIESVEMKLSLN